jgi:hypothetical protein
VVIGGSAVPGRAVAAGPTVDDPLGAAQLVMLANEDRAAAGVPPLQVRSDVTSLAFEHSRRMAEAGDISHNDAYFSAATKARLDARSLGENVAMNRSMDDAHRRLMASPGHRANLLNPKFTVVGVAVVRAVDGIGYVTQAFLEPRVATASPGPVAPVPAPAPGEPAPTPTPDENGSPEPTDAAPPPSPAAPRPTPAPAPARRPAAPAPAPPPVTPPAPEPPPAPPAAPPAEASPAEPASSSIDLAPAVTAPRQPGELAAGDLAAGAPEPEHRSLSVLAVLVALAGLALDAAFLRRRHHRPA